MIIYHGHPSKPSLQKCREAAPSVEHGAEFSAKEGRRTYDEPYIVDNGAFAAHKHDREWNPGEFREMLEWTANHQRDPDFVVVPDVVGDAEATYERSAEWADRIPFITYQPVQDGMEPETTIRFAIEHNAEGIFVGGSKVWKKRTAHEWVRVCHRELLKCHIARPWDYFACYKMGADSLDTTSVVAWSNWDRLRRFETRLQKCQTLTEAYAANSQTPF